MNHEIASIDDIAAIFGDAEVEMPDVSGNGKILEHMYKPQESIFGAVAHDMVRMGWSVFPQELNDRRQPGRVNRKMIRWSEEHHLATELPKPEHLDTWVQQCASLNVAVVLGRASGCTFVIDIDVVEQTLSLRIQELAERMLGFTPLQRVGNWPKMALVYRHHEDDVIESRSPKFVVEVNDENPNNSDQGLEIISTGKAMTFYGKHYRTGRYFNWLHGSPQTLGPDKAPIVTAQQISDFMDAVESLRPFRRAQFKDDAITTWEFDPNAEIHIPKVKSAGGAMDWTEDEEGKVSDGREAYLTRLAYRIVTANPSIVCQGNIEEGKATLNMGGVKTLAVAVVEQFEATAVLDGKWKRDLSRTALDKVRRVAEKLARGEIQAFVPKRNSDGSYQQPLPTIYMPAQPRKKGTDNLDFLPPFVDPTVEGFDPNKPGLRKPLKMTIVPATPEEIETRRKEREIEEDRTRIAKEVSEKLLAGFSYFWDEVYDQDRSYTRIHILKAPTGAGKTSRGISFIAEDPRTKENFVTRNEHGELDDMGRAPILVLMPTYANITELRQRAKILNLDPNLSDHELREQAKGMNLIAEDELPAKLAELRRDAKAAGVDTMIYQGKIRAGCKMKEMVEMAMAAGLGTGGFCEAEIETGDVDQATGKKVKETRYCQYYHDYDGDKSFRTCPAIEQKSQIANSHVIFMPHAFLALSIPEELKNVRAVVADERIHHLFLHTTEFPIDTFVHIRKAPVLRKEERESGVTAEDFIYGRSQAASVVMEAMSGKEYKCPVEALLEDQTKEPGTEKFTNVGWVDAALRSCGASMRKESDITPEITPERLKEICEQPTGVNVREEYHFWKIVQERLEARLQDRVLEGLGMRDFQRKAIGEKEMRIQRVFNFDEEGRDIMAVRISWRTEPNWLDRPLLLLDASAAPEMIEKIWLGKEVVTHDIPAAVNVRTVAIADRTYSNASVVAKPSSTAREKLQSAQLLTNLKKVLSMSSALFGWGRVVAGSSILVRKVVNKDWAGPSNIDWCHFGAMRGLDFAKYHNAAVSIGRMELPTRIVDGLVAALTYDDDVPEQPFDKHGTGKNDMGGDLMVPSGNQIVKLRSGHDAIMQVPMYPGRWARMIQRQYREEELLQFLGRLRPVYREGEPPIWINLSSVIPEDVIVDDILTLSDFLRRGKSETAIYEAMRRCNGVIEPELVRACASDHYDKLETVKRHMKTEGFNADTGEVDTRLTWGVIALKFHDRENKERFAFVRADLPDPENSLRNEMHELLNQKITKVRKISQSKGQTMARGRESDKIEIELGTLAERKANEEKLYDKAATYALSTAKPEHVEHLLVPRIERPLPVLLSTGVKRSDDENAEDYRLNFNELSTKMSVDDYWKSLGYGNRKDATAQDFVNQNMQYLENETEGELDDAASWQQYTAVANGNIDIISEIDRIFGEEANEDDDLPWY